MIRLLAIVAAVAACRGGGKKPHREGSAAPVVMVNQVQLPDAGGAQAGATSDEIEPNDSDDVATPLPLGDTLRGKIEGETDVDHYKLDVDRAGSLQIALSGVEGQDLVVELEDATGAVIAKSDRGAVRTKEGLPNFGVTPGRYTVVVHLAPQKKKPKPRVQRGKGPPEIAVAPAPVYELTAQLVATPQGGEHEPDDDRGTANDLVPSDTVTGFVGWTGDQDVWKLSTEALSGANVLDIEVSEVEGVALELEIENGIGDPLLVRKAPKGESLAVRNVLPQVAPGAPPFHYLVVRGDRSNPETTYRLHTKSHDVEIDAEREPNDTPQHPYAIPSERTRVNGEWTPGDVDCYAIAPGRAARMLDITIDSAADIDLAADMLVDGQPTLKVDHPGRGASERLGGEVAGNAHVVVCVHGGAKAPAKGGGAYTLRVQESGAGDNLPVIGKRRAAWILGMLALINTAAYAVRNELFTVYPDLRARFALHDDRLGLLATAFLVPHALATLLFGWAGDLYDRRRVIAVGMMIAAAAGAASALATDVPTLVLTRALVGFGTAAVVPVANSILGQVYDGPVKASRMSIFNLGLLFGGVVGFKGGDLLGFPNVVLVLAVPCAVLAVLLLMLPVPPQAVASDERPESSFARMSLTFTTSARMLLGIRTLRWLLFSTTAMAFAAGGYNAWLVDFLERDKGMTNQDATKLLVVAMVGAVAGILTGGRLADRLREKLVAGRLVTIALGMALALPCAILCIELPAGTGLYVAGIATMFFMFWYHAPIAVSVDDLSPPARAVAAQGVVIFTMHLVGTAPSSYVVGLVSDHSSLYTAMWVPTGALVVAAICIAAAIPSFAADHKRARGLL